MWPPTMYTTGGAPFGESNTHQTQVAYGGSSPPAPVQAPMGSPLREAGRSETKSGLGWRAKKQEDITTVKNRCPFNQFAPYWADWRGIGSGGPQVYGQGGPGGWCGIGACAGACRHAVALRCERPSGCRVHVAGIVSVRPWAVVVSRQGPLAHSGRLAVYRRWIASTRYCSSSVFPSRINRPDQSYTQDLAQIEKCGEMPSGPLVKEARGRDGMALGWTRVGFG